MTTRTAEIGWVVDYLDDLDADFRVFYRIDGVADGRYGDLSSARFLALAARVTAYPGAMAARVASQEQQHRGGGQAQPGPDTQVRDVPATKEALTTDPVLAGIVQFG